MREQARRTVRDAVGGGADHLVIFTGSGATGLPAEFEALRWFPLPAECLL